MSSFRKGKILKVVSRLEYRKQFFLTQLEQFQLEDKFHFQQIALSLKIDELETTINMLKDSFDIGDEDDFISPQLIDAISTLRRLGRNDDADWLAIWTVQNVDSLTGWSSALAKRLGADFCATELGLKVDISFGRDTSEDSQ